ncbi:Uncharacterized protein Fot_26303 [Forsythia ovata]|uniref:Uncharacterized protein n=1 Tax=Forsythia ovata TaxID=205694 RepID=A0ABD1UCT8_9LAMI
MQVARPPRQPKVVAEVPQQPPLVAELGRQPHLVAASATVVNLGNHNATLATTFDCQSCNFGSSGWTVKVVVAEKFSPRIAQKSPTKYQNLILMDTELSCKLCIPTDEKDFTEIKNIQWLKTVKQFFWIKGKASVTVLNQTYWYMSCNNCNKISSENYGDIYHCVFCKCLESQAIPR